MQACSLLEDEQEHYDKHINKFSMDIQKVIERLRKYSETYCEGIKKMETHKHV